MTVLDQYKPRHLREPPEVVDLKKLESDIERKPLNEISELMQSLTYGEMIELSAALWKVKPDEVAITADNLPSILHRWSMQNGQ